VFGKLDYFWADFGGHYWLKFLVLLDEFIEEIYRKTAFLRNFQEIIQLNLHLHDRDFKLLKSTTEILQIEINIQVNYELNDLHTFLFTT
jgi:hypothetical protein